MADGIDLGIDGLTDFRAIGSGGYGTVYVAREAALTRWVAVKVLHYITDGGRRSFDRDRGHLGRLSGHPNVITIHRFGETSDGAPYLMMEYAGGGSLQQLIDDHGPLPWRRAVDHVIPIARALAYSHGQGILHRDVKPANILIATEDVTKLTDFGIAAIKEASANQTVAFSVPHTAPEAFVDGNDRRDERADLYSLASTLYTIMTGRTPFQIDGADNQVAQLIRIEREQAPALSAGPPALKDLVARTLAKDPRVRPATAAELAEQLEAIRSESAAKPTLQPRPNDSPVGSTLRVPGPPGHPNVATDSPTEPVADRRLVPVVLAGAVTAVVLAGAGYVGFLVIQPDSGDEGASPPVATSTDPSATALTEPTVPVTAGSTPQAVEPSEPVVFRDHADNAPNTSDAVTSVVVLRDGQIASGSRDGTVRVWNPADLTADAAVFTGHVDDINNHVVLSLVALADGRLASGSSDGTVQVWSPDDPGAEPVVFTEHADGADGDDNDVGALLALSDGRLASASADGVVRVWDPDDFESEAVVFTDHAVDGESTGVWSLVQLGDRRLASGSSDGTVRLWDPDDLGVQTIVFTGHADNAEDDNDAVSAIAALADGRIASGSSDGTVRVWDPADPGGGSVVFTDHADNARADDDGVLTVIELDDGRLASGGRDGIVRIWDPSNLSARSQLFTDHADNSPADDDAVAALAQLATGRLASGSHDGTVRIWSPAGP